MSITQKSDELLQAQVALYADHIFWENIRRPAEHSRDLLKRLGEVANYTTEPPEFVLYPRSLVGEEPRVDHESTSIPSDADVPMFSRQEYVDFFREDNQNTQDSHNLADLISNYKHFEGDIDKLGIVGLTLKSGKVHPNYHGSGNWNKAFAFTGQVDGAEKQLLAITLKNPTNWFARIKLNERAISLARARGLKGLERGVAVSYRPPVVVVEKAAGESLAELSEHELQAIPDEHWSALEENLMNAAEHDISIDVALNNFIYDSRIGFTVVDFFAKHGKEREKTVRGNASIVKRLRGS